MRMIMAMVGVLAGVPALAQDGRCRVVDPTTTPLNLRTAPSGKIIGTVENGRLVYVIDRTVDARGKVWAYVGDLEMVTPLGWVYRDYITCF